MVGAAFVALFSPIPGSVPVVVAFIVFVAEVHRAISKRGDFLKVNSEELVMSIKCDVVLQWNATPGQLTNLGTALWRWCNDPARAAGIYQYLDNQPLADLIAGKLPALSQTEREQVHFKFRDEMSQDRQVTIDSLRRAIPAEGVEDILVEGKSWTSLDRMPGMRLFAALAAVGALLVMTQPMLRAQDAKAEQERAIGEIKKLGGKVEVDIKRPGTPVVGVDLKHTKVGDASLEHLKGLTHLEILRLKDSAVTDDGLVYVKGLTNLEVLELGRTKVTDKGLEHLKGFTKLQRLDLGGTEVTDKGLEHLMGLTSLETLNLENLKGVSDFGLAHLKGLINLRKLNLNGTKVTDAAVEDLQKALPKARIIH
jgi:hypothetical protein